MYGGQPPRRAGANGNGNGYAPPPPPPPSADFEQYAPAKPIAPPQHQSFYQPPPPQQQQQHAGFGYATPGSPGGDGGFSPQRQQLPGSGFVSLSPALTVASSGAPPPPIRALGGYDHQQQPRQQYHQHYQPPQQQQYAGSNGFMPQQHYVPPQLEQQHMYQQQQQNPYQPQPQQEEQAARGPDPFQAAQGMAMQFGAAQVITGIAQQFGAGGGGGVGPGVGPQMLQNLGVQGYFSSSASGGVGDGNTFMRVPKHYFTVNHSYVLRKLALLVMPFQRRSWSRRAGVDQRQFERQGSEDATAYLPPRDDVNAPDLYIPVMAFVSYVLLVGFVFGTRGTFTAEVLAKYFSKGFGVLTLEVLVIKLGLYLINARPTPWLDVIAYRGYKFVGVIIAMVCDLLFPRLYYFVFFYTAFAMAIFLMRSHRRIILPQSSERANPGDLPQRNAFLLFVCALQFPIYWLLILDVR
jgi:protein transport protein YIF1